MVKTLALALFILGLISMACGGAAAPTTGVTSEDQRALEAAPVADAFNADIKNFAHQDITVSVGTTVAWTNRDSFPHTTTEAGASEIWDSRALDPGQSFSHTFNDAGTFNYFCAIHPQMTATVTVTGQPAPTISATVPAPAAGSTAIVAPPVAGAGTTLNILDFCHQDLKVEAGTTVTWTNAGDVIHTTTSSGGSWDSGVLESGQTFQFTFTQAGSYPFFCSIHPSMIATITVTGSQEARPAPTVMAASTLAPTGQPAPTAASTPPPTPEPQPEPTLSAVDALTVNADMQNFKLPDLKLQVGTTVVWTNRDPVQHTVTSGSPSDPDPGFLFDSGADNADWVTQGNTYSLTFNQAGVFPYYCRIHGASMSGTITVTTAQPAAIPPTIAPALTPEPLAVATSTALPPVVATPTAAPPDFDGDLTDHAVIQGFAHQDMAVQTGTTVVWTNLDGFRHTTTANEGQWDSGGLQEGESFSFTFTEAGAFSYFCAIHTSMTAVVTVNN